MRGDPGEVVLGRYRIEHQIGRGGFGRIYRARQVALSRDVALKASAPEQRHDVAVRERFRREAVLIAAIAHPNVVTYHDFGTDDDGDMILVMEYLRGRSLYEVIRSGETWPPACVAEGVRQAADGLFAAHQAGIVHRDVKPSNLFLIDAPTPVGRPDVRAVPGLLGPGFLLKVIDFGILRVDAGVRPDLPDLTAPEAVIGTPAYLAPEMLMGTRPDPRADQYALALVACELATGRRAFGGPGNPDSFLARVSRVPPELDLVPGPLASVLARALSPDRDKRFESVVEFAHAFTEAAAEAAAASATPTQVVSTRASVAPVPHGRAGPRRRRGSWKTWSAWTVGVVTAGTLAAWAFSPGRPDPQDSTPSGATGAAQPTVAIREPAPPEVSGRMESVAVPGPRPGAGNGSGPSRRVSRPVPRSRPASGVSPANGSGRHGAGEATPGRLTINARPWADVWLDGTPLGRTPVIGREVTPGSHLVRFEHPTLGARTVTRTVRPGQTLILTEVMDSSAPPPDSPRAPRTP